MSEWNSRIVGYGTEDPEQLLANPDNWRIHPEYQQKALEGVLDEVGWVDDIIVNQTTGHVLDGHLRVQLSLRKGEDQVPVKYVELSEAEEALILATFDPISAAAAADREKLGALLQEVQTGEVGVQALLGELAEREMLYFASGEANWENAMGGLPTEDRSPFQQMTFTLHDSQVETVKAALSASKGAGEFNGSPNQNSNGNALARICEAYINGQG